jgi:hypothetical protein
MARFRKKPVVIEAEQWFPDGQVKKGVHWERKLLDSGEVLIPYVITAHEQRAYLTPGDWIIPEPTEGRYYPCKPDIFAATYEPVDEEVDSFGMPMRPTYQRDI